MLGKPVKSWKFSVLKYLTLMNNGDCGGGEVLSLMCHFVYEILFGIHVF